MNRFSALALVTTAVLAVSGCNPAPQPEQAPVETPPAAPAPAPAPQTTPPAAGGAVAATPGPHVFNTIWMARNYGHTDTNVTAVCTAVVTTDRLKVMRKHLVRWVVANDFYNPCPDLDSTKVTVEFAADVLADDTNPASPGKKSKAGVSGHIETRVHASAAKAPNGRKKYVIKYDGKQASPDPEWDVMDDCPYCN